MWRPRSFIYLLTLTLPFQVYINIGSVPISTTYILIAVIAGLWSLRGLALRHWGFYFPRESWSMVLLMGVIAMSFVRSVDVSASAILAIQVAAYYIAFLAVANLLNTEVRIRRVVHLLLIGIVLSSILGIMQASVGAVFPQAVAGLFFRGPLAELDLGIRNLQRLGDFGLAGPDILYRGAGGVESVGNVFRAFGTFEGPTVYGIFSATVAILAIGFWLVPINETAHLRRLARWAAWLTSMAVFLSWTRSAWLALLVGIGFVFAFRRAKTISLTSKRWWRFGIASIFILSLLILVSYLSPDSAVGQMVLSVTGGVEAAGSNVSRLQTAGFALDRIRSSPILGVGFGNYPSVASGGLVDSSIATFDTAHNTYLELGVELGLPGLLIFVWLLLAVLYGAGKLIEQPYGTYWHALGIGLAGVWVVFMVVFMFSGNIVHPKWMTYWWLLAGLQAAARRVIKQQMAGTVPTHPKQAIIP